MTIDDPKFDQLAQAAVAEAIETHRRMGRPIVVWQDGRVRWIAPEEIEPIELPGDAEARAIIERQKKRDQAEAIPQSELCNPKS